MKSDDTRAHPAGHQARLRNFAADHGFVSGKLNPAGIYVFISADHRVEFAQYVQKQGRPCDLEFVSIPRGVLPVELTDAEILVAAANDLFVMHEDGPGRKAAILEHVIEGVRRLRGLIAAGMQPESPTVQQDFCY